VIVLPLSLPAELKIRYNRPSFVGSQRSSAYIIFNLPGYFSWIANNG
jgi:hypothetical protein